MTATPAPIQAPTPTAGRPAPTPFPPPEYYELKAIVERYNRAWTPVFELRRTRATTILDPHDASDPGWRRIVRMGEWP